MTEPAMFTHAQDTGVFYPANKQATAQAAILSKMKLNRSDLLWIKNKGIPVTYPNGQDIPLRVEVRA